MTILPKLHSGIWLVLHGSGACLKSGTPAVEVSQGYAPSIGRGGATSSASRPGTTGIQPGLNSFDLGADIDGLSESEDILKASLDQPSEAGSGSAQTPTRRKNPLNRGRGGALGRGAGFASGLLGAAGGAENIGVGGPSDAASRAKSGSGGSGGYVPSRGRAATSGAPLFGSAAGSDYAPSAKASSGSSPLSALKPKAKSFSMSAALGGNIDWSQASDPRW